MPPPKTPIAFGIKDYGKDYVVFVWELAETGRKYMIEIADNISFTNSQKYTTDVDITEYKVDKLKPNTRYYARLLQLAQTGKCRRLPTLFHLLQKDVSEYTGCLNRLKIQQLLR